MRRQVSSYSLLALALVGLLAFVTMETAAGMEVKGFGVDDGEAFEQLRKRMRELKDEEEAQNSGAGLTWTQVHHLHQLSPSNVLDSDEDVNDDSEIDEISSNEVVPTSSNRYLQNLLTDWLLEARRPTRSSSEAEDRASEDTTDGDDDDTISATHQSENDSWRGQSGLRKRSAFFTTFITKKYHSSPRISSSAASSAASSSQPNSNYYHRHFGYRTDFGKRSSGSSRSKSYQEHHSGASKQSPYHFGFRTDFGKRRTDGPRFSNRLRCCRFVE